MKRQGIALFAGLVFASTSGIALAQSVEQKAPTAERQMTTKPSITEQQSAVIKKEVKKADQKAVAVDDLSVGVDTQVPSSVVLYELPPEAAKAVPEYFGHKYVIVKNQIVIVDPVSRKVMAVVK